MMDGEDGAARTASSSQHSAHDETSSTEKMTGAVGEPDTGHEEVEKMDSGHEKDLERQRVRGHIC